MKIGIISDFLDKPFVGVNVYIYNLVRNLTRLDRENQYYLIHTARNDLDVFKMNNDVIIPAVSGRRVPYGYLIWRLVQLPPKLKKMNLDVVHDTVDFGPLAFRMPFKTVQSIHDLAPFGLPQDYLPVYRIAYRTIVPRVARNADKIIVPSAYSKQELLKRLMVQEEKIRVVHLGASEAYRPLEQKEQADVVQKYHLDFPFVLDVSPLERRKNLPTLIRSFGKLKNGGLSHKLVIAGNKPWRGRSVLKLAEDLGLAKEVIFLGYVPDEDLPKLYNAADLFVFPSYYEGFGVPPLEAMACGTPVITSNAASLPEVVGDAALMVAPHDIDGLAEVIHEVLTNERLRQGMVEKGLKQAKRFSWEKCARETLQVYQETFTAATG